MFAKIKEKFTFFISTIVLLNASAFSGFLMSQAAVEEIVVTARKKAESLQDVPLSVSALRESSLEDLGVNVFEDYLLQLPSVTAGGAGPGTSTIYIRGLASTTPNLTTAGVGGLAPNVSFYLDEQPMAQPGRNLDVYAADIGRIEILKGPQGTLFGASLLQKEFLEDLLRFLYVLCLQRIHLSFFLVVPLVVRQDKTIHWELILQHLP